MSTLVWFRQDLRLADNPALAAAAATGEPVIPVYICAPGEESPWGPGSASRWWLHGSLSRLDESLRAIGSALCIRASENSLATLKDLARECGAQRVVWNRRYEPAAIARDRRIKAALSEAGLETQSFNGALLHEPWTIHTRSGGPFQVFTAFWRSCKSREDPAEPKPAPVTLRAPASWPLSQPLDRLELLPTRSWPCGLEAAWTPGCDAAHAHLEEFLADSLDEYGSRRDQPAVRGTSRMSPHVHFGEIGPREIWHAARRAALARGQAISWRDSQFLTEIGWREFAYHLLFHFPNTPEQPLRANYGRFPWRSDAVSLRAWQRGATGYPIVDAGMRELWRTGWMHNRVRMIAGSFLVKDLLLSWTEGARWCAALGAGDRQAAERLAAPSLGGAVPSTRGGRGEPRANLPISAGRSWVGAEIGARGARLHQELVQFDQNRRCSPIMAAVSAPTWRKYRRQPPLPVMPEADDSGFRSRFAHSRR